MPFPCYRTDAPKKATNLSINTDLLRQAREAGINLSQVMEERLAEILAERRRAQWQAENREALESYNRRIAAEGTFGDDTRGF